MSFHPALTLTTSDSLPYSPGAEPEGLRALRREYESKLRRAHETILSLDNLLAPQDWLDAGDGFGPLGWRLNRPAQRTQDRTHGPLSYLSEEEWRQHVALARDLCTRNHLALGFRDHVSNFIGPVQISFVLRGSNPGATSTGPRDANGDGEPDVDPLVRACTRVWEDWCRFAEWGQGEDDREEECRRRLLVEGEATVRFFVGDEESGGLPYVRHLEPELIRTPPGSSTIDPEGWGVVTAADDDEREEGLWVCRAENVSEGRLIGSGEYVRVKGNVDRTVKRGLSDFFPVGEQLRKVLGLLDNMAHVARLQAAIAWWEQYPTATLDQVSTQVRLGADYQRVKLPPTSVGSSVDVTSYEAGTVVRTEGGREVRPGPVSAPNGFEAVERMVLRSVGFRWGCPSYFSGDGDASFASVLVTGSPFVRITEARQERAKAFGCRVASRVLELCERSGRLPVGSARRVRPVGVCRPVVIADEEKKARTFLSLYGQNCADPVEFVRSTGADPKVVAANIRAWKKKFDPPAQPGAGPGAGGMPGGGPAPAPPGSAGGDGSSPNANPMGEGRKPCGCQQAVQESEDGSSAAPGEHHDKNGKKYCLDDHGKQTKCPDSGASGAGSGETGAASASAGPSDTGEKEKDSTETKKNLAGQLAQAAAEKDKYALIAKANVKNETKVEAAGQALLGPAAVWQETADTDDASQRTPRGLGHDLRIDTGDAVCLIDMKTRKNSVSIPDRGKERASKIGELLVARNAKDSKPVVQGYIHVGNSGATFVTGYPVSDEKSYKPVGAKRRAGDESGEVYDDVEKWKTAVLKRLKNKNDLSSPLPALQLSPNLTGDIGAWTEGDVISARERFNEATKFLGGLSDYHELVENQARARLVGDLREMAKSNPNDYQTVIDLIDFYAKDPNNAQFLEQVTNMGIIQDRAIEKAAQSAPEKIVQAVQGMADSQSKAAVAQAAVAGLSDEDADAAGADLSDEAVAKMERMLAAAKKRKASIPPAPPPS